MKLSALIKSGVTIGSAVFLEESQPVDVTINGSRYLRSGNIETDSSLFDATFFTNRALLSPTTEDGAFAGADINDVVFAEGLFVAVGNAGKISTSPDGATWTARTSGETATFNSVAHGGGVFVAVGESGKIVTSATGVTWATQVSSFSTTGINGVAYDNGLFVAVGDAGKIATSPDGNTWTQRTNGFGAVVLDSVAGSGAYFAVTGRGAPRVQTSADGITWLDGIAAPNDFTNISFGNGVFVASSNTVGPGVSWTTDPRAAGNAWVGASLLTSEFINNVRFSGGEFKAVTNTRFAMSSDGTSWRETSVSPVTTMRAAVSDGADVLVIVGDTNDVTRFDYTQFAGSQTAHAEFGENQYIRIS